MVKIFISYSSKNIKQLEDIVSALTPLQDSGTISELWYDRDKIRGGDDFHNKIIDNMYRSDIILILMSREFFYSNYCKNTELALSKNLMKDGKSRIVPILLSECSWEKYISKTLHVLPSKDTPILKETGNKREILLSMVAQEVEEISNLIIDEKKVIEQEKNTENTDNLIPANIQKILNKNKKEILIGLGILIITLFLYFIHLNNTISSLKNGVSDSIYQPHKPYQVIDSFEQDTQQQQHYVEHGAEIKKVSLNNKNCINQANTLISTYGFVEENRNFNNLWLRDSNYKVHIKCYTKYDFVLYIVIGETRRGVLDRMNIIKNIY